MYLNIQLNLNVDSPVRLHDYHQKCILYYASVKGKTHQIEREREYAREEGCDDRRENRVTVNTPTRQPTRHPTRHVRRDNRRDAWRKCNSFENDRVSYGWLLELGGPLNAYGKPLKEWHINALCGSNIQMTTWGSTLVVRIWRLKSIPALTHCYTETKNANKYSILSLQWYIVVISWFCLDCQARNNSQFLTRIDFFPCCSTTICCLMFLLLWSLWRCWYQSPHTEC